MKLNPEDFEMITEKNSDIILKKEHKRLSKSVPYTSVFILLFIILGCIFAELIINHNPLYMDLKNTNISPCKNFYFGTDHMGRDIFSMIWYGGRISLFIGLLATFISTTIAIVYGSISAISHKSIDNIMMRFTEIILSIPSILTIIFIQAVIGSSNPVSIACVIGITNWMDISKIVRIEVMQIKNTDYILVAKSMGGKFFYILLKHLSPNFIPSIMFMVVTNIATAITTESTLSFLGIGLPIEIISWGSMLSQADRGLLSNSWWIILIPGIFLVITLVCITDIGNYIRNKSNKKHSNL